MKKGGHVNARNGADGGLGWRMTTRGSAGWATSAR